MAGRGPAPKGTSSRARDEKRRVAPELVVESDDEVRGPDLPESMDWPAQTRAWWETWRESPQAQAYTATDWDYLMDTALLHAELWTGNGAVAAELRLRVAKFGATPEDRQRLKMQIVDPAEKPKARKTSSARRSSLLKVVGDQT